MAHKNFTAAFFRAEDESLLKSLVQAGSPEAKEVLSGSCSVERSEALMAIQPRSPSAAISNLESVVSPFLVASRLIDFDIVSGYAQPTGECGTPPCFHVYGVESYRWRPGRGVQIAMRGYGHFSQKRRLGAARYPVQERLASQGVGSVFQVADLVDELCGAIPYDNHPVDIVYPNRPTRERVARDDGAQGWRVDRLRDPPSVPLAERLQHLADRADPGDLVHGVRQQILKGEALADQAPTRPATKRRPRL